MIGGTEGTRNGIAQCVFFTRLITISIIGIFGDIATTIDHLRHVATTIISVKDVLSTATRALDASELAYRAIRNSAIGQSRDLTCSIGNGGSVGCSDWGISKIGDVARTVRHRQYTK